MALAPTSWTGTQWPGSYGPSGQLYQYGGKFFKTPQELYSALGQTYDANVLPYGTTTYSPGQWSGMSDWDASVRNNAYGPLDRPAPAGGTSGLYANASAGMAPTASPAPAAPAQPTSAQQAATSLIGGTQAVTGTVQGQTAPAQGQVGTGPGTGTTTTPSVPIGSVTPGPGSLTPADVFDPLTDARASVYRALRANNYNPDIPTYGINQMLKRAEDLVWGGVGRVAYGGNPDTITTPGALQDYIGSLVGMAGRGESGIMPTRGQGRDYLQAINNLMQGPTMTEGGTYLGSILGANPNAARALVDRLALGSLAPSVRQALQGPLENYPTRFAEWVETPEGFGIATQRNALDILLNNLIPGFRPYM